MIMQSSMIAAASINGAVATAAGEASDASGRCWNNKEHHHHGKEKSRNGGEELHDKTVEWQMNKCDL